MAARETGKQRASRIPLDYYKGWTPLEKWFALGGIVAFVAAVAWPVGAFFLRSDNGNMLVSRGHVTAKHGAWDANCAACHDSFSPMNERVILSGSVSNQKCTNCHPGPQHAANQLTEQSCASCHRDHQGREHSLVRIPDSDCTTCHSNLPSHTKGGSPEYEKAVSRFNKDYHPEFRSLKSDPGKLKFNHKLHMSPGIVGGPNDAGTFTLARMDPADQERYKALLNITDLNAPLQLTCAACHATDSSAFGMKVSRMDVVPQALLFPQRSPGDYMLPISYENQCRACHPTTFDRKDPKDLRTGRPLIHGLQPEDVKMWLEGYYTSQFLAGNKALFEGAPGKRPLPGQVKPPAGDMTLTQRIDKALADVFRSGRNCGECHYYEDDKAATAVPVKVVPTNVPSIWFQHAKFNHASHRAVDCKACHDGAYNSTKHTDVLVPNRDNCVQCHAPQSTSGGQVTGGARFDCVECHRYHNGGHPAQGLGAAARVPPTRLEVEQFLSGRQGK